MKKQKIQEGEFCFSFHFEFKIETLSIKSKFLEKG